MMRRISFLNPDGVTVVCHRGANHVAPENTFAAAAQCIAWGAHYIEVDVRTSKDGELYILHDPTVDRTTNGSGPLRELTAHEIDHLDAGSWFDPMFSGERIPRLSSFLHWIGDKAGIFFDVKDANLDTLLPLVRNAGFGERCFFWFDNDVAARRFREIAPDLALKINAGTVEAIHCARDEYDADIIELGVDSLSPASYEACRERDMLLMVLEMRKNTTAFRSIIEQKADLVNLDYPDTFLTVQRQTSPTVPSPVEP